MEDRNIAEDLQKLQDTLDEIKALLAWEKLKHSEVRPGQPPGFTLYDPVEKDISEQYSQFLALDVRIHAVLNNPESFAITPAQSESFSQRLNEIEDQFNQLGLFERFIKF